MADDLLTGSVRLIGHQPGGRASPALEVAQGRLTGVGSIGRPASTMFETLTQAGSPIDA
ncbi:MULTISPECIES: hypothetical protein [unclassified Sphingomonas]|uniref:hypothetical protein n=1 Tax=unclassified Sphingomonas TaxID=196159 RepID=UPI000A713481|nr:MULTISPECIES: hypothetical protein [unclassified Sphingomonas]